ncbi:hypothetical protein [Flavobacterium coralii]|uniref:hypothetical protein n=1 Tax=Flavobacterium coralii TaxID=2838017 RepID=UPI000C5ECB8C|nr:hypothetical protein [Flavobacterium sp.]|tara:strand:- start:5276 stop:5533 length:258 start_codon:yes stop_codon:yes gene_type:complete
MPVTIRLKISRDIDTATEKKVLKLRGCLIARGFTDIIHFEEDGPEHYIHYFTTETALVNEAREYIADCIVTESLSDTIELLPEKG